MSLENSPYKVIPKKFNKEIDLPTSKSVSNRALIIGARLGNGFTIRNLSDSTDVINLLNCLEVIGVRFKKENDKLTFLNSFPECEKETNVSIIDLFTGDGGTTNRFLVALLSLGKKTYRLFPSEKLRDRPIDELLMPLRELGVSIKKLERVDQAPFLEIKGPVKDSNQEIMIVVDSNKSTQFATSLMLSFFDKKVKIVPMNVNSSSDYLEMTRMIIEEGKKNKALNIPIDFSSASYPMAYSVLYGHLIINNCHQIDRYQADSFFINILKSHGADIEFIDSKLEIKNTHKLKPFSVDGSHFPDLVLTLAFLASKIEGESEISNLRVLQFKESDRISELLNLLNLFEVDYSFNDSNYNLKIRGSEKKCSPKIISPVRDHRVVMTAYLFLKANSGGGLYNTDCIKKSYPKFLSDLD